MDKMERCKMANEWHDRGFNCAQSVLAAFADRIGMPMQELLSLAGGFGAGTGTGELCGAVSGAVMALGLMTPVDLEQPVVSKKRTLELSKEFQKRFTGIFEGLRCSDLIQKKYVPDEKTSAAAELGISAHCAVMIVTAVEILTDMLEEREAQA